MCLGRDLAEDRPRSLLCLTPELRVSLCLTSPVCVSSVLSPGSIGPEEMRVSREPVGSPVVSPISLVATGDRSFPSERPLKQPCSVKHDCRLFRGAVTASLLKGHSGIDFVNRAVRATITTTPQIHILRGRPPRDGRTAPLHSTSAPNNELVCSVTVPARRGKSSRRRCSKSSLQVRRGRGDSGAVGCCCGDTCAALAWPPLQTESRWLRSMEVRAGLVAKEGREFRCCCLTVSYCVSPWYATGQRNTTTATVTGVSGPNLRILSHHVRFS